MAHCLALVIGVAVHLLLAGALEDWVAYSGSTELGPPSRPGSGWLELELARRFQRLAWEVPGQANGYRYYNPNATHYLLGRGSELVEVWQPFGETPRDAPVPANIRGALYSLYRGNLSKYRVKLRNANWTGVVVDTICRQGSPCPNTILLGDTQVPARVAAQNTRPLNDLFARYLETHMRRLPDDFPPLADYEYNFNGNWVAIPLMTDLRLLRFNRTTVIQVGQGLPPPHGNLPWAWEDLADLACKISAIHGDGTGIFMSSDYDEDYKYAMMMAQSAGMSLFRRDANGNHKCGLREPRFAALVDNFWKRIFHDKCATAMDGNKSETYWNGVEPPGAALNATLGTLDPASPPPQWNLSRYINDAPLAGEWLQPYLPGFAFTTGVVDKNMDYGRCAQGASCPQQPGGGSNLTFQACRQAALDSADADTFSFDNSTGDCRLMRCEPGFAGTGPSARVYTYSVHCSDIWYADMPGNVTFLGGSGLILPVPAPSRASGDCAYMGTEDVGGGVSGPGGDEACKLAEDRRVREGWRIMLELSDKDKPWILQMNTMKGGRMVPPVFSKMSKRPFTDPEWQPGVTALFNGRPSQYPNTPIPEAQYIEKVKPVRIMLLRAIYGNGSTMSAIEDGCAIADEQVRPCNASAWLSDPRCRNPLDDLPGCRPGEFLAQGHGNPNGQSCQQCKAGKFQEGRGVERSCVDCPPGQFAASPGSTRCDRCAQGMAAAVPGMSACRTCENGAVGAERTGCAPCPQGRYRFQDVCEECPAGKTSKEGSLSESDCTLTPMVYVYTVFLLPLVFCLVSSLPLALGRRIPIEDISMEDGQAVVRTWGLHHVLRWPPTPLQVRLRDTGHPALEGRMLAKFKGHRALVLLGKDGSNLKLNVDASMGSVEVCLPDSFWRVGLRVIPFGLIMAGVSVLIGLLISMLALHLYTLVGGWALVTVLLAVFTALVALWKLHRWRARFESVPLTRRRREFRKRLHFGNPDPRPCPRGPQRAVTAGQLCDFYETFQDFIRLRSMYYATANILLPLTKPEQLSYAELVGPSLVHWFVSHYWGSAFKDLVSSLCKHAEAEGRTEWRTQAFWICSFSNNQWQVQAELGSGDPLDSSFYLALRSEGCRGTAMVLDHLATPLTRSWCLFEVFQTFAISSQRQDFMGLLLCTPSGVLQHGGTGVDAAVAVAHKLATISLEDATATSMEDKQMIDGCVRGMPGGFTAMNRFVRECIKRALQAVHRSFENDFQSLVLALDQVPGQSSAEFAQLKRAFTHQEPQQSALPHLLGRASTDGGTSVSRSKAESQPGVPGDLARAARTATRHGGTGELSEVSLTTTQPGASSGHHSDSQLSDWVPAP